MSLAQVRRFSLVLNKGCDLGVEVFERDGRISEFSADDEIPLIRDCEGVLEVSLFGHCGARGDEGDLYLVLDPREKSDTRMGGQDIGGCC